MFKILVLSVLLCQTVFATYDEDESESTGTGILSRYPMKFSQEITPKMSGVHNYYATHQIFYFGGGSLRNKQNTETENLTIISPSKPRLSYKVHPSGKSWDDARKDCIKDGGHLAVMRTTEDLEALKSEMKDWALNLVWVGYHDRFTEGEWISVLNEPIKSMKWGWPWSTMIPNNPDNADGNENCAAFLKSHNGLNDDNCERVFSYACSFNN